MEKTLQDICREAKEYQHLTTQDLADLTDLSSSTISNLLFCVFKGSKPIQDGAYMRRPRCVYR